MTIITNQATTNYQFSNSPDVLTQTSNINEISLENPQGLTITKSSNTNTFSAGDIITYTVNITNNSNHYLSGVRIIDNLGNGNLAYVLGSAKLTVGSLTYTVNPISTNPLTFTLQQLNVGQSMTLTYNGQVIFNLPSPIQTITNTVQGIGYTSSGTITGFANNTIQKKSTSGFSVTKTANKTSVFPNEIFSYYISLTNNSSLDVILSKTRDNLPTNFVLTSVKLKIGSGNNIELTPGDYSLVDSLLTVPAETYPTVNVPANSTSLITITGYFA